MSDDVLIRVENGVGRITLNRPQALHSLTTGMCAAIDQALIGWEKDDQVRCVMVDHADGTRGFCAGGDIRQVAISGRSDGKEAAEFFATEYRINVRIKRFSKPFIAIIDGVTMGGGVGISVHGSHRIATENTLFAMPETGIGLFPDVGGGWFLPRLDGELGTWLALTGARLKGADVVAAGIATHFMPSGNIAALKQALLKGDNIDAVLARLSQPAPKASWHEHAEIINRCFAKTSVTDICIALKMADDDWATAQAEVLRTRSPLSLSVSLRQLRLGRAMTSFEDVMQMEYGIACRITRSHDFSEGVRAVVEDKDNAPRWSPPTISGVTPVMVERMFIRDDALALKLN